MSRYFTRARVEDADGWAINPGQPYMTREPRADERPTHVDVSEHEAVDTGLLDARGDAIWRGPNPIGFGRDGEW